MVEVDDIKELISVGNVVRVLEMIIESRQARMELQEEFKEKMQPFLEDEKTCFEILEKEYELDHDLVKELLEMIK